MPDVVIRKVPRHHWIRPFLTFDGDCEPGHGWLYRCVRRDAWRIGRLGFGLLRMPYDRYIPAEVREGHTGD